MSETHITRNNIQSNKENDLYDFSNKNEENVIYEQSVDEKIKQKHAINNANFKSKNEHENTASLEATLQKEEKDDLSEERKEKETINEILNVGREVKISNNNNSNLYEDSVGMDNMDKIDEKYSNNKNNKEKEDVLEDLDDENYDEENKDQVHNNNYDCYDNEGDDEDHNIKLQNKHLKQQILLLSSKIGDYITTIKDKNVHTNINNIQSTMVQYKEDFSSFHLIQKEISFYKDNINKLKAQMEGVYNVSRIENLENELKVKKDRYMQLKQEESVLEAIQKSHLKVIDDLEDKYDNKQEINLIKLKIQTQKEELRIKKDLLKTQETKIKDFNNQIFNIELKTKQIKDKLEYLKNQKNLISNFTDENNNNLKALENTLKDTEEKYNVDSKFFRNENSVQNDILKKLINENEILCSQLKEKNKLVRLNELKLKELEKNNHGNNKSNKGINIDNFGKIRNNNNNTSVNNYRGNISYNNPCNTRALSVKYNKLNMNSHNNNNNYNSHNPNTLINNKHYINNNCHPQNINNNYSNNNNSNIISNKYKSVSRINKTPTTYKTNSISKKSIYTNIINSNNNRKVKNHNIISNNKSNNFVNYRNSPNSEEYYENINGIEELQQEKKGYKNEMLCRIEQLKNEVEDLIRSNESTLPPLNNN